MRPLVQVKFVAALLAICAGCQQPVVKMDPLPTVDKGGQTNVSDSPMAGTASCAGRGCHASLDQSKAAENPDLLYTCSYTLFSTQGDPHNRAWQVLSAPRGERMSELLHNGDKTAVTRDRRCLACHATPQSVSLENFNDRGIADKVHPEWQTGVGCESCHGRATAWRERHYLDKWKTNKVSAAEKEKYGYNDLTDLRKRAMVCAGCHVGAPADDAKKLPLRDMNHDHVAAGHPRLMFEFVSFMSNLPPHWSEKDKGKEVFAEAWYAGQLASAEAAMRLTADRAKHADKDDLNRPWPELTEYDCYGCHQTLSLDSWRAGMNSTRKGDPGRFRPSRWYVGLLEPLGAVKKSDLDELASALRKPRPPAEVVAKKAGEIALALSKLPGKPAAAGLRSKLIERGMIADPGEGPAEGWQLTWDECEQIALGLLALERAGGGDESKALALLKLLRFPEDYDSKPDFRQILRDGENKKAPFDKQWYELFSKLK